MLRVVRSRVNKVVQAGRPSVLYTSAPRFFSVSAARNLETEPIRPHGQQQSKSKNPPRSVAVQAVFFFAGVAATSFVFLTKSNNLVGTTSTSSPESVAPAQYGSEAQQKAAFKKITELVGLQNVSATKTSLDSHSDTTWSTHRALDSERPGLVVFPESTEQVSAIMKICHAHRVPVTPFCGGTSLEGHFTPTHGGVCLDFSMHMDSIIKINKLDLDAVVQPGVGWETLNEVLADQGLFFGPDPGPGAQIGGMIGTSCSGTNAVRYGTMRENVLALTVVLADGTVIRTKQRPRKSAAGYNLTGLFVGSEGTLGIVTEAVVRLVPLPQNQTVSVVTFDSVADACSAASEIIQQGVQVGAVELLDTMAMATINKVGATARKWKETPTLFFKFSGTKAVVADCISQAKSISRRHGSKTFEFARSHDEQEELWSARKNCLWSTVQAGPCGNHLWTTDVAVPVSELATMVSETRADVDRSGLFATFVGHVGDGNFHALVSYDPNTERDEVEGIVDRMVKRALDMGGTCTGEHGVGAGKKQYLLQEVGAPAVNTMRRLKLSLDPLQLLNPGKVID